MVKKNGFTLVEILLVIGVISLACISVYTVFNVVNDWQKASNEATGLQNTINRVERATSTNGVFTGLTLETLPIVGGRFTSYINMTEVVSPSPNVLNFVYKNISTRVCSYFVPRMVSNSGNVKATINGTLLENAEDVGNISSRCNNSNNDITITVTSKVSVAGLSTVIPSGDAEALYEAAHPRTLVNAYHYAVMIPSINSIIFNSGGTAIMSYADAYSWFMSSAVYASYASYSPVVVFTPACASGYEPAKNYKLEVVDPPTCQLS